MLKDRYFQSLQPEYQHSCLKRIKFVHVRILFMAFLWSSASYALSSHVFQGWRMYLGGWDWLLLLMTKQWEIHTAGNTVELQGRQFCKTYLGLNLKCCSPVPNGRLCSWRAPVVHIWWNRGALMQGKRAWGQLMQGSCTMLFPKQTLKK